MKLYRIIILILIVCLMFFFTSQAIVRIKTLELSFYIARAQLFNYELSSKMLRARFRSQLIHKDNYQREVKMNVLESGVLNFQKANYEFALGALGYSGLFIVNAMRSLTFKPFMALEEDQGRLLLLQYAFYMERMRNYKKASEKYEILEMQLRGSPGDHSFVLLHNGYSLALLGETRKAVVKLKKVKELYPGTRNADDASLLLRILEDSQNRQKDIQKRYTNERDRAIALFEAGQYAAALKKFKKLAKLTDPERYSRARSLEGVGRSREAVGEYLKIISSTKNAAVAKKANRRLLMIGTFYQGGKKVKKIAEKNAVKLGDDEAIKVVKKGEALQLKPSVIEKIKKKAAENKGKRDEQIVEQLEELRRDLEETMVKEEKAVAKIVEKAKPIRVTLKTRKIKKFVPEKVARIEIHFIDGRKIFGRAIDCDGSFITVYSGNFHVSLPYSMVKKIEMEKIKGESRQLHIKLKDGTVQTGIALKRYGENIIIDDEKEERKYPENYFKRADPFVQ